MGSVADILIEVSFDTVASKLRKHLFGAVLFVSMTEVFYVVVKDVFLSVMIAIYFLL